MASTTFETARQSNNDNVRPSGRRGRGHRGRGGRNVAHHHSAAAAPGATTQDQSQNSGKVQMNLKEDSTVDETLSPLAPPTEGDQDSASMCWICAEAIKFYCVSECNHRMCHECAIRLRALYKKQECAFCKHPQLCVILTASADKLFSEFDLESMPLKDTKLSIYFETEEVMEDTFVKLRYNCPDPDCEYFAGSGWNDLKAHIRGVHSKSLCELCIRFKKVFVHEHTLYTRAQLLQHMPSLSHRPGSSSPKGQVEGGVHPMCEFCRECYFGDDELFVHMRERHEECFVCKKADVRDQYFRNYESLEEHFRSDHYPCTQAECLAKKFVVFGSSMDLQAHMMDEHGTTMTARDRKEARRVVAEFDYDEIPGSGGRRRREREPPPLQGNSSAPRLSRRDGFGSTLTTSNNPPSGSTQPTRTNVAPASTPTPVASSSLRETPPSEPVDHEVAQRHAIFVSRFNALTNGSAPALQAAKAAIRSYRASESSARDLITTIHTILEQDLNGTSTLVGNIADLLEDEEKKKDLLSSLNGFKVEQRSQFPDLVPIVQGSAYSGVTSGRALNMKHATAARSSSRVWDRVAQAAGAIPPRASGPQAGPSTPANGRFPTIMGSSSITYTPAYRQAQRSTPWASTSVTSAASAAASTISSRIASESRARPQKATAPSLSGAAFPSLPVAAARNKPVVSGNQSLRNIVSNSGPATNAWTAGSGSSAADTLPAPAHATEGNMQGGGGKGKKKKGKEKLTLFTLGTHAMSQT